MSIKRITNEHMCAFQCDSCFHNQVCSDEPNTRALNEECALYANVKNFTDVQQLKAEIAAVADLIEKGYAGYKDEYFCHRPTVISKLRQLSAV